MNKSLGKMMFSVNGGHDNRFINLVYCLASAALARIESLEKKKSRVQLVSMKLPFGSIIIWFSKVFLTCFL